MDRLNTEDIVGNRIGNEITVVRVMLAILDQV